MDLLLVHVRGIVSRSILNNCVLSITNEYTTKEQRNERIL